MANTTQMTSKQNKAIARIVRAALERAGGDSEIKHWRVADIGGAYFVSVETGRVADENTMAAVLCRTRGAFVVGRRGGVSAVEPQDGRKANARKHPLIYGFNL